MRKYLTLSFLFLATFTFAQKGKTVAKETPTVTPKATTPSDKTPKPSPSNGIVTLTVDAALAPCSSSSNKQCLQVLRKGADAYESIDDIEGFAYELGYTYTIQVKEILKTPPIGINESLYRYKWIKTVRKKEEGVVNTPTFEVPKQPNTSSNETVFTNENGKKIGKTDVNVESVLDKKWYLRKLKDVDGTNLVTDDNVMYMTISTFSDRMEGFGACNKFAAVMRSDLSTSFNVSKLYYDFANCGYKKLENLFFELLQTANKFEVRNNHFLILSNQWNFLLGFTDDPDNKEDISTTYTPQNVYTNDDKKYASSEKQTNYKEPFTPKTINESTSTTTETKSTTTLDENKNPVTTTNTTVTSNDDADAIEMQRKIDEMQKALAVKKQKAIDDAKKAEEEKIASDKEAELKKRDELKQQELAAAQAAEQAKLAEAKAAKDAEKAKKLKELERLQKELDEMDNGNTKTTTLSETKKPLTATTFKSTQDINASSSNTISSPTKTTTSTVVNKKEDKTIEKEEIKKPIPVVVKNTQEPEDKLSKKELKQKKEEEKEEAKAKALQELNKNLKSTPAVTPTVNTIPKTKSKDDDLITVGIFPFKGQYKNYVLELQNQTIQSFAQKSRFTVVDRTNLTTLKSEKELQKTEDFMDGYVVDQGKSFGAKFVVTGELQNIGTISQQFKRVNTYNNTYYYETQYAAYLNFSVTLLETETGQIKSSNNFNLKTNSVGWAGLFSASAGFYNNEATALSTVMNGATGYIKAWINNVFPVSMKIIKIDEFDKKGNPSKILIKGGADTDLKKGSDLFVIYPEVIEVDGREYTKPTDVGQIKVLEVDGEFSTCKIKSGGERIQELITQGKSLTLSIKSYK